MNLKQRLRKLEVKVKARPKEPEYPAVILAIGKSEAEIAEIEASLPKGGLYIILDL